jgi:hypothetical protein
MAEPLLHCQTVSTRSTIQAPGLKPTAARIHAAPVSEQHANIRPGRLVQTRPQNQRPPPAHPAADAARAARKPAVCPSAHEPERHRSPEWSNAHAAFISDCLADLNRSLIRIGTHLTTLNANVPDALDELARHLADLARMWSHEETGGRITFDRDKRVRRSCNASDFFSPCQRESREFESHHPLLNDQRRRPLPAALWFLGMGFRAVGAVR